MREDRDVKAEWHRKADELLEKLWSICDDRKSQNEETKRSLMEARARTVQVYGYMCFSHYSNTLYIQCT